MKTTAKKPVEPPLPPALEARMTFLHGQDLRCVGLVGAFTLAALPVAFISIPVSGVAAVVAGSIALASGGAIAVGVQGQRLMNRGRRAYRAAMEAKKQP